MVEEAGVGAGIAGLVVAEVEPQSGLDEPQVQQISVGLNQIGRLRSLAGEVAAVRAGAARPPELGQPQRGRAVTGVHEVLLVRRQFLRPGHLTPRRGIAAVLGERTACASRSRDAAHVVEGRDGRAVSARREPVGVQRDPIERPMAVESAQDAPCIRQDRDPTLRLRGDREPSGRTKQQLEVNAVLAVDRLDHRVLHPQQLGISSGVGARQPG